MTGLVFALVAGSALFSSCGGGGSFFVDYDECPRRCVDLFGPEAAGVVRAGRRCECRINGQAIAKVDKAFPKREPPAPAGICGDDGRNYRSSDEAMSSGVRALHAGFCGGCSTKQDINVYRRTRKELTRHTTRCALNYLFVGRENARACLNRGVGFTQACTECWLDNIACTIDHCFETCFRYRMQSHAANNAEGHKLNECLACDEMHCGTPFIRCAGANRRRSGIASDIDRPGSQIWRAPAPSSDASVQGR